MIRKTTKVCDICGYCERNFAGDKDTRLSVSGFYVFVMGCHVLLKSCGQKNITLSSTKDDYVVISKLCAELLFVRMILNFLGKKINYPIIIRCSNLNSSQYQDKSQDKAH